MIQNTDVNFESKVVGDKLIRTNPSGISEIVLTQQEFTECYRRWVLPLISQISPAASNVGSSWEQV